MKIHSTMITTTFELHGYKVIQSLGVARGISVRSRSIIGGIGAGIQTLFGGNISLYTSLCEKTRQEAFEILIKQAEGFGANAIIGMRYDATEIAAGVTEVIAYGTAVIVDKEFGAKI